MTLAHTNPQGDGGDLLHRLWIYTNYDCNLSCSYCVAESFVGAERNGLTLPQVCRLIDEAVEIGMTEIFFTGGEPFILHDIFTMLRYGLERMQVTVLSNGNVMCRTSAYQASSNVDTKMPAETAATTRTASSTDA